jgi:glycerophosphoryl diester phosphodiesterase
VRLLDRALLPYPVRPSRPLVYAHRGASAAAPENTLEAFALAQTQGADGVELDVMVCGSGEVVVCHDPWLDRLAGIHVSVHETPFEHLRTIDVARHMTSWRRPARIPTLDEVLASYPGLINIELKEERWNDGGLAQKVATEVKRHHARERVSISSFNPLQLARMRLASPELPLGFLCEESAPLWLRSALPAPLLACQAIHPEQVLCSASRVHRWHQLGFKVAAWTIDDPTRAEQLASWGVDAVITNQPRRIRQVLERTRRLGE